jgi:ADP-ribosylglycohydrolase
MVDVSAFTGCLLGLAIGDALGYPAEFRKRAQILEAFGPEGLRDFVALHDPRWSPRPLIASAGHPPGTYSDDTQMTIALSEALAEKAHAPLDELMNAVAERFVDWSRSPDNDRAPGNACMSGCRKLAKGVPWDQAGVPDSKGCGSAMRVAPIGLVYQADRARLLEVARASSVLTHGHDAGIEGAAAAALLVAMAMERSMPEEMYGAVEAECCPRSRDFAACWARLKELRTGAPEVVLTKEGIGEAWVAEEAVASALYCFWRSPDDFARVVLTGANTDGDSDSIACIAGSIAGAYVGEAGIPEAWRRGIENAGGLVDLARRLHAVRRD